MPFKSIKYSLFLLLILATVTMIFAQPRPVVPQGELRQGADTLHAADTSLTIVTQSIVEDTTKGDTTRRDSLISKPFLDEVISGKNDDSLVYDLKNKMVYIYKNGEVNYQNMTLKADYMRVNLDTKNIYAHGKEDTAAKGGRTRPEFLDASSSYTMDTITYNLDSKKAKIKGVSTHEGEGYLHGQSIKKMPDNMLHIAHGKYTTCDADCPHFYLHITKGKMQPGKKIVFGPSYLVVEDVPIYFLGIPFGFFPITSTRTSGFILPSYGEEYTKGFFIRDAGYYFAFNDYVDMSTTASIYTLGSWDASLNSRYIKRYKYSGNLSLRFSKDVVGEKGSSDFYRGNNFSVAWSHQQDSKFRPNSTFSASVNFSSSGYAKYGSTNLDDYLNTQTNSSISYSKSWTGTPFSLSTNMQLSQNSHDKTYSLSFPNMVFNVARFFPLQRKNPIGKQRWYEKISMSYTGTLANTVNATEDEMFTEQMFKKMKNGINHTIPISTSMNVLKYINISPSANYTERWYFQKVDKEWSDAENRVVSDTTYGFHRLFNYNFSVSASTKVYSMFQFGKKFPVQAIRWVMTPSASFGYTPDFGESKYGYYKPLQTDSTGMLTYYSPYEGAMYGVPGRGKSMSLSFGLQNNLEAKVLSKSDTSGVRKIKIIDNFSINSSYNFLADSLQLAPFSLSLRMTFVKNFGLNISAVLDPYWVNPKTGVRTNRLMIKDGKLGRIASTGWSFGYTFNSKSSAGPAINDIKSGASNVAAYDNSFLQATGKGKIDPMVLRQMMVAQYYDFSIPWNLGFNYSMGYNNNGVKKNVTQTLGFNGSVNLTPKWGITFNGGYDFQTKSLTPGVFTLSRDLHCWQMSFNWVPIGFRKSWSFNISVKSAMLKDLKYDKSSSFYDNILDQ